MTNKKTPKEPALSPTTSTVPDAPGELQALAQSDLGMIRIVEDLIDVLIARDHIRFTDLPEHAQKKLLERKSLRTSMNQRLDLLDNDEDADLI